MTDSPWAFCEQGVIDVDNLPSTQQIQDLFLYRAHLFDDDAAVSSAMRLGYENFSLTASVQNASFQPVLSSLIENKSLSDVDPTPNTEIDSIEQAKRVIITIGALMDSIIESFEIMGLDSCEDHSAKIDILIAAWKTIFLADDFLFVRALVHVIQVTCPFSSTTTSETPTYNILHILRNGVSAVSEMELRISLYATQLIHIFLCICPIDASFALANLMVPRYIGGKHNHESNSLSSSDIVPSILVFFSKLSLLAVFCGRDEHMKGPDSVFNALLSSPSLISAMSPLGSAEVREVDNYYCTPEFHQRSQDWFHGLTSYLARQTQDPSFVVPQSELNGRDTESCDSTSDFQGYTSIQDEREADEASTLRANHEQTLHNMGTMLLQTTVSMLILMTRNLIFEEEPLSTNILRIIFTPRAFSSTVTDLFRICSINHDDVFHKSTELLLLLNMIFRPLASFSINEVVKTNSATFKKNLESFSIDLPLEPIHKLVVYADELRTFLAIPLDTLDEEAEQNPLTPIELASNHCNLAYVMDKLVRFSYVVNDAMCSSVTPVHAFANLDLDSELDWVQFYIPDFDVSLFSQTLVSIINDTQLFLKAGAPEEGELSFADESQSSKQVHRLVEIAKNYPQILKVSTSLFILDTFTTFSLSSAKKLLQDLDVGTMEDQVFFYSNDIRVLIDILLRVIQEGDFLSLDCTFFITLLQGLRYHWPGYSSIAGDYRSEDIDATLQWADATFISKMKKEQADDTQSTDSFTEYLIVLFPFMKYMNWCDIESL